MEYNFNLMLFHYKDSLTNLNKDKNQICMFKFSLHFTFNKEDPCVFLSLSFPHMTTIFGPSLTLSVITTG